MQRFCANMEAPLPHFCPWFIFSPQAFFIMLPIIQFYFIYENFIHVCSEIWLCFLTYSPTSWLLFWSPTKSALCFSVSYECGAIHCSMGILPMATPWNLNICGSWLWEEEYTRINPLRIPKEHYSVCINICMCILCPLKNTYTLYTYSISYRSPTW